MLAEIQSYALIFLLGSFTVASLSDLRRMAAQRDFAEVWFFFTFAFLLYDLYGMTATGVLDINLLAKWAIVLVFVVVSINTHLLSISLMDVAAVCSVLSLLDITYIVLYLITLVIIKEILGPVLRRFGDTGAYPFLPVVLVATIVLLAIIWSGGIDISL